MHDCVYDDTGHPDADYKENTECLIIAGSKQAENNIKTIFQKIF